MPNRLQFADGTRIEPPVSSPIPIVPRLAATPAPVPALEPPGSLSRSYGFFVCPPADEYPNHEAAKSGRFVLARTTAPASLRFSVTVASVVGT
jgi:hypothetical protein